MLKKSLRSWRGFRPGFASLSSATDKLYESHIPTTPLQRVILGLGSSAAALLDPWRGDMVAVSGEVLAGPALVRIQARMAAQAEGAEVLQKRPRINSRTVDFNRLRALPLGTLGRTYADFSDFYSITPDTRDPVHFVDDPELAYVIQRYRDIHDIVHAVLEMPTNIVGEVAVKWVEALQTGLPMCIGAALLAPARFGPKQTMQFKEIRPWVVKTGLEAETFMNVFFEQRWEQDLNDFRRDMNFDPPPTMTALRKG